MNYVFLALLAFVLMAYAQDAQKGPGSGGMEAAGGAGSAREEDLSDARDCLQESKQRVQYTANNNMVSYRSRERTGRCSIESEVRFGCDGSCEARAAYRTKGQTSAEDARGGVRVRFLKVYASETTTNDAGQLQLTGDRTGDNRSLGSIQFSNMACECVTANGTAPLSLGGRQAGGSASGDCDEDGVVQCSMRGDTENGATVEMRGILPSAPSTLEGGLNLDPNTLKMDFSVTGWTFGSASERLVIEASIASRAQSRETDPETSNITVTNTRTFATDDGSGFGWIANYCQSGYVCDEADQKGVTTVVGAPEGQDAGPRVTFIFNEQGDVYWDPSIYIGSASPAAFLQVPIMMLGLVILATLF